MKKKKGFTLVELIAVIAMMGIIGTAVMGFFIDQNKVFFRTKNETKLQDEARIILSALEEDLRIGKNIDGSSPNTVKFKKSETEYKYTIDTDGVFKKMTTTDTIHRFSGSVTELKVEKISEDKQYKITIKLANKDASDTFISIITPRNK